VDQLNSFLDGIEEQLEWHLKHVCPDCPTTKSVFENLAHVRNGLEKLSHLADEGLASEKQIQEQLRDAGSCLVLFRPILEPGPDSDDSDETDIETVRTIKEPFRGSARSRIEDTSMRIGAFSTESPPELFVLWAIEILKLFALQHVEDIDDLTRAVFNHWSAIDVDHEAGISPG